MRLSTRTRYALRMMLDIAKRGGEHRPVSLTAVSERSGVSHAYLDQLTIPLRSAGLLEGVLGRRGGYLLARTPAQISIEDIVEAMIGPISVVFCVAEPGRCERHGGCEARMVHTLITHRIAEVLRSYTLADLMDPSWKETFTSKLEELKAPPDTQNSSAP